MAELTFKQIKEITLFVFDTLENFQKTRTMMSESLFKNVVQVNSLNEFQQEIAKLNDDDALLIAVHVFGTENVQGVKNFTGSGIPPLYPNLPKIFVTEKNDLDAEVEIVKSKLDFDKVHQYHKIFTFVKDQVIIPCKKKDLASTSYNIDGTGEFLYDYAIITALYTDEFEELKHVFNFPEDEKFTYNQKQFYVGYLRSNASKKVIATVPNATGLVDSAIVATMMLDKFKPKYLLMSGVCGGAQDLNFGDVIIAKQIFAFQKGKLNDHPSIAATIKEELKPLLFDEKKEPVLYNKLYDKDGKHVPVTVEQFQIEHDAILSLDTVMDDKLKHELENLKADINLAFQNDGRFLSSTPGKKINVVIEPMASGTMVINKKGFFKDVLASIDRKVAAVEMESYGIARACKFANSGKTIPIIFKSVMDHTAGKEDVQDGINVKKLASYTSAQLMKSLLERNII